NSTSIHASVTPCSQSAIALGREGRAKAGCDGMAPSCISSDIPLHSWFQARRGKAGARMGRVSRASATGRSRRPARELRTVYSEEDNKGLDRYEFAESLGKNLRGEGSGRSQLVSTAS